MDRDNFIFSAIIVLLILGIGWTIAGFSSFFTVDPGEVAFITRFGSIESELYTEWLHFKSPFTESVVKMDTKTQNIVVDASAASKDLQNVATKVAINCSINPNAAKEIYKSVWDEAALAINVVQPAIQEAIKSATAKFTAEELITKRDQIAQTVTDNLKNKLNNRGINVQNVNIVNFQFSPSFDAAIEDKVKAEQEALTAKNQLAQIQYEWEQAVTKAKAGKEAKILAAEAEAEAIKIQTEAIKANGGEEYVELKRIDKWDGKYPTTITNWTPLLNIK